MSSQFSKDLEGKTGQRYLSFLRDCLNWEDLRDKYASSDNLRVLRKGTLKSMPMRKHSLQASGHWDAPQIGAGCCAVKKKKTARQPANHYLGICLKVMTSLYLNTASNLAIAKYISKSSGFVGTCGPFENQWNDYRKTCIHVKYQVQLLRSCVSVDIPSWIKFRKSGTG